MSRLFLGAAPLDMPMPPLLADGVEERCGKDYDDEAERQPPGNLKRDELFGVEKLDEEFHADPRDDDKGSVDERRIALDERQELADHQAHHDDAEDAA